MASSGGGGGGGGVQRSGTVKKSIWRSTKFVKCGAEAFLRGAYGKEVSLNVDQKAFIVADESAGAIGPGSPVWKVHGNPYGEITVNVGAPKKKTMGRSSTIFTIKCSNLQKGDPVKRSMKHFQWPVHAGCHLIAHDHSC